MSLKKLIIFPKLIGLHFIHAHKLQVLIVLRQWFLTEMLLKGLPILNHVFLVNLVALIKLAAPLKQLFILLQNYRLTVLNLSSHLFNLTFLLFNLLIPLFALCNAALLQLFNLQLKCYYLVRLPLHALLWLRFFLLKLNFTL